MVLVVAMFVAATALLAMLARDAARTAAAVVAAVRDGSSLPDARILRIPRLPHSITIFADLFVDIYSRTNQHIWFFFNLRACALPVIVLIFATIWPVVNLISSVAVAAAYLVVVRTAIIIKVPLARWAPAAARAPLLVAIMLLVAMFVAATVLLAMLARDAARTAAARTAAVVVAAVRDGSGLFLFLDLVPDVLDLFLDLVLFLVRRS